ncbi:hypothetical protein A9Q96_08645 [Rhodobacterales bacterium 52_120_T64]|nr:hypothetical protein A9Q96_08645 [Rhodobacterales bacterium 52_120_T64]
MLFGNGQRRKYSICDTFRRFFVMQATLIAHWIFSNHAVFYDQASGDGVAQGGIPSLAGNRSSPERPDLFRGSNT